MNEFFIREDGESSEVELSLDVKTSAFYQGTAAIFDFSKKIIIPQLSSMVKLSRGGAKLSDHDEALINTYYRMYAWIATSVSLDKYLHYQAIATASRIVMELLFDIHFLLSDCIPNPVEKYWAFHNVELYRVAKLIVEYKKEAVDSEIDESSFSNYLKDHPEDQHKKIIYDVWGLENRPRHWTGLDMASRARKMRRELEDQYMNFNAMLSWNIHSGSIGHAGLKSETFKIIFGHSHSLIQALFIEGTEIISKEFELEKIIDWIPGILNELRLVPGEYLLDKEIEKLKKLTHDET